MANIISKRPFIGFISGGVFSALGVLIFNVDSTPGSMTIIRSGLYKGVGSFLIFVGVFSIIAAVLSVWSACRSRKHPPVHGPE